jgi:hypothetical protein
MSFTNNENNTDPILTYPRLGSNKITQLDDQGFYLYTLSNDKPTDNQIMEFNNDGSSQFIDASSLGNPNALISDNPLVTPQAGSIILSDGINPFGTVTNPNFNFNIDPQGNPTLGVGGIQMISQNNNMFLRSADNIETGNNMILKGPASIQTSFQHGTNNNANYVKTYVDKDNFNFITDNQIGSVTEFKGASQYFFDNNIITSQNVIINQGNSLALNNDTDQSNIKLYKENGLDGNFFIDNQTGSKTTFKGANSYNFDNSLNIGSLNTSNKIFLNGSEFKPPVEFLNNYYVSSNGSDLLGDGSISNSWKTIGKAVSVLNALVGDITAVINVASGQYLESDIIITKSGISIIGANSISTIFTGDIYFNMAVSSLFYSVGQLANISVYGCIYHANLHLFSNSLSISSIISAPPNGKSCLIMSGGAGIGGDCSITNNSILYANSDTIPIVLNQSASLTGVGFQIQNNPTLSFTLQSYIQVLDNARCNLFGCSLINSSNNANVGALIDIYNTVNVTSSSTINNCIFLYPAGVATTTGAIINFRNTASSNTVNFYNNFCRCFLTQNAPNNYIVLKSGGGAVNFSQAQNIGRNPQHHIPATGAFAGWTKTTFPTVI